MGFPIPPRVMEPILWPAPFADPAFAWEVKWDGIRLVTYGGLHHLQAVTKGGRRVEERYPELAALVGREAVWDGEMVVIREGKADFPALLSRHRGKSRLPATYMVFDLLYWKGKDLRPLPYEDRRLLLAEVFPRPGDAIAPVDAFPGEQGRDLFGAIQVLGWEGLVAKRKDAPYRPGPQGTWRKVKAFRVEPFWVGGWLAERGSLLLGKETPEGLAYVGRAAYRGGKEPPLRRRTTSPFLSLPSFRETPFFVDPSHQALIRFLEWTPKGLLRSATFQRWVWDTSR
ncbi:MAG: hypothetical protein QJR00_03075 [Bacillota bacterium]|nr:hypothetical protein [Bacillota bacterium]